MIGKLSIVKYKSTLQDLKQHIVFANCHSIVKRALCILGKCSHIRAHSLFLESLTSTFPAVQCNSYDELQQQNKCTFHNVIGKMGGDITANTEKSYGVFFLETKSTAPFCIPDYRNFSNKTIVYPPKIVLNKINV